MQHRVQLAALLAGGLIASSASAAVIIPGSKVSGGNITPTGTLVVIDVPTPEGFPTNNNADFFVGDGDFIWTGDAGVIATPADNGFQLISGGIRSENYGNSNWEPDGTPEGQSRNWAGYPANGGIGTTIATFNFLAASGVDIPDGSTIHGIYTTWDTRRDTAFYTYTEGVQTDTASFSYSSAPAGDLQIDWVDDVNVTRTANFQQILSGPITVEGGDGFVLRQERRANTAHLDAVIIDFSGPLMPSPHPVQPSRACLASVPCVHVVAGDKTAIMHSQASRSNRFATLFHSLCNRLRIRALCCAVPVIVPILDPRPEYLMMNASRTLFRSLLAGCLAFCLTGGVFAQADTGDKERADRPTREEIRQRILDRYDRDGNGRLDRDERRRARDRIEDVRDRREDVRDRKEDKRDRAEDIRDRKEDIRDRREDVRDEAHDGGLRDRLEDRRDRAEDIRDRREDVRDRAEDKRDRAEDIRDRKEDRRDRGNNKNRTGSNGKSRTR